jgi:hypothetical protein
MRAENLDTLLINFSRIPLQYLIPNAALRWLQQQCVKSIIQLVGVEGRKVRQGPGQNKRRTQLTIL